MNEPTTVTAPDTTTNETAISNESADSLTPANEAEISNLLGLALKDVSTTPTAKRGALQPQDQNGNPQDPAAAQNDPLAAAAKSKHPPRKLDGIDPEDIDLFNQMSRPAYEKLYKVYTEHKAAQQKLAELEQAQQKPGRYYDHPDAYRLSEEYQQLEQLSSQVSAVKNFWTDQLAKIEAGEPYQTLTRNQQGQLVPSAPIDPTPQARAQIISKLTQADVDLNTLAQQTRQFQNDYRAQYSQHETGLKSVFERMFGKHVEILKPIATKELETFPQYFRNTPEANLLSHGLAAMRMLSDAISERDKTIAALQAGKKIASANGPAVADLQTGPSSPASQYNDEEYKNVKSMFQL